MTEQLKVSEILSRLYDFDESLRLKFARAIEVNAVELAAKHADADDAQFLKKYIAGEASFDDLASRKPEVFNLYSNARREAEKQVRESYDIESDLFEKSLAWQSAIHWVAARVTPELENVESVATAYASARVARHRGDRLGSQFEHIIWEDRQKDPDFRKFQRDVAHLDDNQDCAIELLNLVWRDWPEEARAAELPPAPGAREVVTQEPDATNVSYSPKRDGREYRIMQVLYEGRATDPATKLTTSDIATKADGAGADANALKDPVAKLARAGIIETRTGRNGGCFLTEAGAETARSIFGNSR